MSLFNESLQLNEASVRTQSDVWSRDVHVAEPVEVLGEWHVCLESLQLMSFLHILSCCTPTPASLLLAFKVLINQQYKKTTKER